MLCTNVPTRAWGTEAWALPSKMNQTHRAGAVLRGAMLKGEANSVNEGGGEGGETIKNSNLFEPVC